MTAVEEPLNVEWLDNAPPFTQVADWVALSGISDHAKALYWHLAMHINTLRGDREVWPTKETLAVWMQLAKPASLDRYMRELVEIGAVQVVKRRTVGGMRTCNRYRLRSAPPAGYAGPTTLGEFYRDRASGRSTISSSQVA